MPGEDTDHRDGQHGWQAERGQTMAEYVVVLAVITVAIVLGFATMAGAIQAAIDNAAGIVGGVA